MKLVLFSGGGDGENLDLDRAFVEVLNKRNPVVTFIPSSSYLSEQEFKVFVKHYSKYRISRFIHFPIDVPFDRIMFTEVMRSDAIHLAGGNTFYFLRSLRRAKLLNELRRFVERGGVLTGLSAGAILMTSDIDMAGYPDFDRDENSVGLKNLSSLGLVDFAFFPHFRNSTRYDTVFKKYSKVKKKLIYACPDGAGIVINGPELRFIGKTFAFSEGHKFVIN